MVAQIGVDNQISIKNNILSKICNCIGESNHETGGILGMVNHSIVEFEFDTFSPHSLYEYYPSIDFFETIINEVWGKKDISFCGMIHSHLHNNMFSAQDISYFREIIKANSFIKGLIMGIYDLSEKQEPICWYQVDLSSVERINIVITQ